MKPPKGVGTTGVTLAMLLVTVLSVGACGKKQAGAGAAEGRAAEASLSAAGAPDLQGQEADEGQRRATEAAAAREPLPPEAGAGGASVWVTFPSVARSIERLAALIERLRGGGGELAALLPAADALRAQAEQALRGGVLGQLLGLPDPSVVDLSQPVRLRISLPASGGPMLVVALGTTRPVEPLRAGKLVGAPSADGRYLVGVGVEPDPTATWPAEEPGAAEQDVYAELAVRSAAPALVKALGDLQNAAARAGGGEPLPPWFGEFAGTLVRYSLDVSGIDRLTLSLKLGTALPDAPLRATLGFRAAADSPVAAAFPLLAQGAPPFGLLEAVDAGADMWLATRMNPAGVQRMLAAMQGPTERFVREALGEEWRDAVLELYRAMNDAYVATDGRLAGGVRTLEDGRSVLTFVWGVSGRSEACRAALRRGVAAAVPLLQRLSDKFSLGATVSWTEKFARAGAVDVDRLTVVVPRAALGAAAAALQPGTGDLRWDISFAVGANIGVATSDPDPAVVQRALAGSGRGGGVAAGSPLAARLAAPEPDLLELGTIDLAAGFRGNHALGCPPGTVFPALPVDFETRVGGSGFQLHMDFLRDALEHVMPVAATLQRCAMSPAAPAP